jgi:hypothetical protein
MKQISGFKDGIYFHQWKDQQYSTNFWVIICPEGMEDVKPFIKRLTRTELEISKGSLAMCLQRFQPPDDRHNVMILLRAGCPLHNIVHECVHAKNYVFEHHGVRPDVDNDEHEAYYVDYLFKNTKAVLDDYWNITNKVKNGKQGRKGKPAKKA